jgi:hypothetical protein
MEPQQPLSRRRRFAIFAVAVPLIGFASMGFFAPLTSGAHDGGFLGMAFGLLVSQLAFAPYLIQPKGSLGIAGALLAGFLVFALAAVAAWALVLMVFRVFETDGDPSNLVYMFIGPVIFFAAFLGVAGLSYEMIHRAMAGRPGDTDREVRP